MKTAARDRRLRDNERGARSKAYAVGKREPPFGQAGIMRVDENTPRHSSARRRQANFRIVAGAVHGYGGAIDAIALRRCKDGDEDRALGIAPPALCHRAIGVAPFDVGELARVERRAGQESVARKRGIGAASRNQARGEGDQRRVSRAPVDRTRRVVLGVGVVVAALAEAELRAHAEHGRPARGEQQRHEIALVTRARLYDRRIVAWALHAVVPAEIVVRPVVTVLAVGFVVLAVVGDEVAKGEAVVGDDEVDALGRRRGAGEQVARTGHPGCDLAALTRIATPEAARGVAKAVVPLGEGGAELAEAVAARSYVPGFGDEAGASEHGIGAERLEERRVRVEAARAAPERRPQIEAKAVETAVDHPAPERADRHLDDQRAVKGEAISGAGVVDVKCGVARVEAEPGLVVEAAKRQCRPKLIAFAVMVEDDVENSLHARGVQRVGGGANLLPAAGSKARIGRAEHDRVVTPCVRQPERGHVPVVDERVRGHDLDRGDPERGEMRDRGGMREPREGSARGLGDRWIEAGEPAQVELVDDERLGRDALVARLPRRRRPGDRLGHVWPRVLAECEHRGMEAERPVEPPGVGIGEQFRRVEAASPLRLIRALDAEAVARAGAEAGRNAAQDAVGVALHRRASNLAVPLIDAQRGALRVGENERRFEPARRDDDAACGLQIGHSAGRARSR